MNVIPCRLHIDFPNKVEKSSSVFVATFPFQFLVPFVLVEVWRILRRQNMANLNVEVCDRIINMQKRFFHIPAQLCLPNGSIRTFEFTRQPANINVYSVGA